MNIKIDNFCDNQLNANTYLISFADSCLIVDPANDLKILKRYIGDKKILGILLTHGHYDHFKSLFELLKNEDVTVYMHKNAVNKLSSPSLSVSSLFNKNDLEKIDDKKIKIVNDGDVLTFNDLKVKCLYLPGHTSCSVGYLILDNLFSGDTLFLDSVGRRDLPTGDYLALKKSLEKIKKLDKRIVVYPGHDQAFVLEDALKVNQYLK